MSKYYPINLILKGRKCLVIGAGAVAERKIRRLLECGARITVVSPEVTAGVRAMAKKGAVALKKRKAVLKDLRGAYLVIAATADRAANTMAYSYCNKNGILINVVDRPKECTFIVPSILKRGDLTISISTDGVSPTLARSIRIELQRKFGREYAQFLRMLKTIRPRALERIKSMRSRKAFFQKAVRSDVMELLRRNKADQAKRTLERILEDAVS